MKSRLFYEMVTALRYAGLGTEAIVSDLDASLFSRRQIIAQLTKGLFIRDMKNVQGQEYIGQVTLVNCDLADLLQPAAALHYCGEDLRKFIIPLIETFVSGKWNATEENMLEKLYQRAQGFDLREHTKNVLEPIYREALHHRYYTYLYAGEFMSNGGQLFRLILKGCPSDAAYFMAANYPEALFTTETYSALSGSGVLYNEQGEVKKVPYSGRVERNLEFERTILNTYRQRKLRLLL